jgi:hypothetical protein
MRRSGSMAIIALAVIVTLVVVIVSIIMSVVALGVIVWAGVVNAFLLVSGVVIPTIVLLVVLLDVPAIRLLGDPGISSWLSVAARGWSPAARRRAQQCRYRNRGYDRFDRTQASPNYAVGG